MLGFGLGLNKWRRVGGGFVGLLDLYPNAEAAHSLRLLRKDYSGGLIRARAWDGSANQGEADVMAYRVSATEYVLDLNSTLENLDATAISRGLTTSDTLADLVSTGVNDYDGLTSAWYDQSLSNDATQGTAAAQPKIVSGGSLVTENGKPAIDFDGVDDKLTAVNNWTTGDSTSLHVLTVNDSSIRILLGSYYNAIFYNEKQVAYDGTSWNESTNAVSLGQNLLEYTYYNNGGNIKYYNNGVSNGSSTLSGTQQINNNIGSFTPTNNTYAFDGKYQELIHYNSDQSANRAGIETNINTFYSIYP